jgi:uncharacterized LabA/DUF88 family protein
MRYNGPAEITYLFVDGASLSYALQDASSRYFSNVPIEIDYSRFGSFFTKIFYYDAIPVQEQDESEADYKKRIAAKESQLRHIRSFDRYHVYEGEARRRKGRGLEQKKVDVLITVDMLMHSFRGNMHKATLLTGDLDFKPLIDALVQDGMFVTLWYPTQATNDELITAADARQELNIETIHGFASEDFKKRFPIPTVFLAPERQLEGTSLISTSNDAPEGPVELYLRGNEYLVIFQQPKTSYLYHVSFSDPDFLRLYLDDRYNVILPSIN